MPPVYTKEFITYYVDSGRKNDRIVIIGSPMSVSYADEQRFVVRGLLGAATLEKLPAKDFLTKDLVIVSLPAGPYLCRALVTDIQLKPDSVKIEVLLVDECRKDISVSPEHLYACPKYLATLPTVVQQYILADVLPVSGVWSADVIQYLQFKLINRSVPAILDIEDGKYGYISPLEPDEIEFPVVCRLLIENRAVPAATFPGLVKKVLEDLGKEFPDIFSVFMLGRKDPKTESRSARSATYHAMPLPTSVYEECYISHCVVGPWKFYLQFKHQRDNYMKLQGKLRLYYDTGLLGQSLFKIGSNVLCCIKNLMEEQYQRGLITGEMYMDEISVYLVDKGVTLKCRKDTLWELPVELLDTPICMFKCSLDGLPALVDTEMTNMFSEIVDTQPLKARIVKLDDVKVIKVSMLANGQDVHNMITPALKKSTVVSNSKVFISYVCEEEILIYVQLSSDSGKLESLQGKLQQKGKYSAMIECPRVGMVCAAQFEDGYWYRGTVLEIGDCIKVKYVDYGNSGTVSPANVRQLSLEFITDIPTLAVPCILNKVPFKAVKSDYLVECLGPIGEREIIVHVVGHKELRLCNETRQIAVVEMRASDTGLSLNMALNEKCFNAGKLSPQEFPCENRKTSVPSASSIGAFIATQRNQVKSLNQAVDEKEMGRTMEKSAPQLLHTFNMSRLPEVEVKPGTWGLVNLSHVGKAGFFVTLIEKEEVIKAIKKSLCEACQGDGKMRTNDDLARGWLVATSSASDNAWHRGLVTGCVGNLIELFLIDSGKDVVVEKHLLQKLPGKPLVLTSPAQALKCTLSDGNLTTRHLECMQKDIGRQFAIYFDSVQNGLWEVKMYSEREFSTSGLKSTEDSNRIYGKPTGEPQSKNCNRENKDNTASLSQKSGSNPREDTCIGEQHVILDENSNDKEKAKVNQSVGQAEGPHSWDNQSMQHSAGPIRNKNHRYHTLAAIPEHQGRRNGDRAYNNDRKFEKRQDTPGGETQLENPERRPKEFGLFRNNSASAFQETGGKLAEKSCVLEEQNRTFHDKFNKAYVAARKQEKNMHNKSIATPVEKSEAENSVKKEGKNAGSFGRSEKYASVLSSSSIGGGKVQNIPQARIKFQEVFTALITNVDDDGSLWIQALDQVESLDQLMNEINESNGNSLGTLNALPNVDSPCLSLYAEDGRFYRSVVKEVMAEEGLALVHYVDYGNSNAVKLGDMRAMHSKFLGLPCQAIHCYFRKNVGEPSLQVIHKKILEIIEEELKLSLDGDCVISCCTVNSVDILSQLTEEMKESCTPNLEETKSNFATSQDQHETGLAASAQISALSINYNSEFNAYFCYLEDGGSIWIQISEQFVALDEMMQKLDEFGNIYGKTPLSSPVVGNFCLCKYSEDQRFYRAVIKGVDSAKRTAQVHYVDYGNCQTVVFENMFAIPKEFMILPRQAMCCYFSRDLRNCWSPVAQKYLEELQEQEGHICLIEESEDGGMKNIVSGCRLNGFDVLSHVRSLVFGTTTPVREEMVGEKLDTKKDAVGKDNTIVIPEPSLIYKCDISAFVCHVENGSVWIQLSNQCSALYEMMEKLNESSSEILPGTPVVGAPCISYYAEDERFYRALVKEIDADQCGAVVHYVDYGNSGYANIKDLRDMSVEFLSLPRQAVQCKFNKATRKHWSQAAQKHVEELIDQEVVVSLSDGLEDERNVNILCSFSVEGRDVLSSIGSLVMGDTGSGEMVTDGEESHEEKPEPPHLEPSRLKDQGKVDISASSVAMARVIPQQSVRYGETFAGFVCHVENKSVWIQATEQSSALEEMMEKLHESSLESLPTLPPVDTYCVSLYTEDGRYYRAVIKEVDADQTSAVVHYVDYGNSDTVKVENLCALPDYFCSLPVQAIQCHFSKDIREQCLQPAHNQIEELLEQNLNVSLCLESENECDLNVFVVCAIDDVDVLSGIRGASSEHSASLLQSQCVIAHDDEIEDKKKDAPVGDKELPVLLSSDKSLPCVHSESDDVDKEASVAGIIDGKQAVFPGPSVRYKESFFAQVCHIESDGSFWIQGSDDLSALDEMMERINELSEGSLEVLKDVPTVGSVCLSRYILDGRFYRAVVKEVVPEQGLVVVHYVDYGNEDNAKVEDLRKVPDCFFELAVQAIHCYFCRAVRECWSQSQRSQIGEIEVEVKVSISPDPDDDGRLILREFIVGDVDVLSEFSGGIVKDVSKVEKEESDGVEVEDTDAEQEQNLAKLINKDLNPNDSVDLPSGKESLSLLQTEGNVQKLTDLGLKPEGIPSIVVTEVEVSDPSVGEDEGNVQKLTDLGLKPEGIPSIVVTDETEVEVSDPSVGEVSDPSVGEVSDPSVGEVSDPSVGEMSDPSVGEMSDPSVGEASDPPVGEASDPPVGEVSDPSVEEVNDPSVEEVNNPSVEELVSSEHIPSKDDIESSCLPYESSVTGKIDFKQEVFPKPSIKYTEIFSAVVCHVEIDGSLWIQRSDELSTLGEMMAKISQWSDSSPEPFQGVLAVGSACICPYALDGTFYRTVVKEMVPSDGIAVVHFVDYGNEDVVKVEEVLEIPDCFLEIPVHANHCYFGKSVRKHWSPSQQSRVEEIEEVNVSLSPDPDDDHLVLREFVVGDVDLLLELSDGSCERENEEPGEIVQYTDPQNNREPVEQSMTSIDSQSEHEELQQVVVSEEVHEVGGVSQELEGLQTITFEEKFTVDDACDQTLSQASSTADQRTSIEGTEILTKETLLVGSDDPEQTVGQSQIGSIETEELLHGDQREEFEIDTICKEIEEGINLDDGGKGNVALSISCDDEKIPDCQLFSDREFPDENEQLSKCESSEECEPSKEHESTDENEYSKKESVDKIEPAKEQESTVESELESSDENEPWSSHDFSDENEPWSSHDFSDENKPFREQESRDENNPSKDQISTDENEPSKEQQSTDENEPSKEQQSTDENKPSMEQESTDENEPPMEQESTDENETSMEQESTDENEPSMEQESTDENEPSMDQESTDKNEPSTEQESTDDNKPSKEQKSADKIEPAKEQESTVGYEHLCEHKSSDENEALISHDFSDENKPFKEQESTDENEPSREQESNDENELSKDQESIYENEPSKDQESTDENEPSEEQESTDENEPYKEQESTDENEPYTEQESTDENEPCKEQESTDENEPCKEQESTDENEPSKEQKSTEENEPVKKQESTDECEPSKEQKFSDEIEPSKEQESIDENEPSKQESTDENEPSKEQESTDENEPVKKQESTDECEPSKEQKSSDEIEPSKEQESIDENEPSKEQESTDENEPSEEQESTEENESSKEKFSEENEPCGEQESTEENEDGEEHIYEFEPTECKEIEGIEEHFYDDEFPSGWKSEEPVESIHQKIEEIPHAEDATVKSLSGKLRDFRISEEQIVGIGARPLSVSRSIGEPIDLNDTEEFNVYERKEAFKFEGVESLYVREEPFEFETKESPEGKNELLDCKENEILSDDNAEVDHLMKGDLTEDESDPCDGKECTIQEMTGKSAGQEMTKENVRYEIAGESNSHEMSRCAIDDVTEELISLDISKESIGHEATEKSAWPEMCTEATCPEMSECVVPESTEESSKHVHELCDQSRTEKSILHPTGTNKCENQIETNSSQVKNSDCQVNPVKLAIFVVQEVETLSSEPESVGEYTVTGECVVFKQSEASASPSFFGKAVDCSRSEGSSIYQDVKHQESMESHHRESEERPDPAKTLHSCKEISKSVSQLTLHQEVKAIKPVFKLQPMLISGSIVEITRWAAGPGRLFLQLEGGSKRLQELQQTIGEIVESLQEPEDIQSGMACIAQSGKEWYRATVMHVGECTLNVCYVDYGNSEIVSTRKVRQIPINLLEAACCYCAEFEEQGEVKFTELEKYFKKPLVLTTVDKEGKWQRLSFQYCGKAVLEEFVFSFHTQLALEPALTMEPTCSGLTPDADVLKSSVLSKSKRFLHCIEEVEEEDDDACIMQHYRALLISVDEHPFSLWVQREEDFAFASFIESTLEKEGPDFEKLDNPEKGQLCLSVLKGVKERVKLISFDQATAHVHYIDQGKYGIVLREELWRLQDDLIDIHPLASQVFLPVTITKGMESVSVLAVAEVALGALCFCIDIRTKTDRKIKTLIVSNDVGDLGKYLVNERLATSVNFESDIKSQLVNLLNEFCLDSVDAVC